MKSFTIYAEPVGKVNMRPVTMKGHMALIQPKTNSNYMTMVKNAYLQAHGNYMFEADKPLELTIRAYYSIPKNTAKYKIPLMEKGEIRPTKKPDCDNISKIVCDSLNKLAFADDSQIVSLRVYKYYSKQPCVTVSIEEFIYDEPLLD